MRNFTNQQQKTLYAALENYANRMCNNAPNYDLLCAVRISEQKEKQISQIIFDKPRNHSIMKIPTKQVAVLSLVFALSITGNIFASVRASAQKDRIVIIDEKEQSIPVSCKLDNIIDSKTVVFDNKKINTEYEVTFYYSIKNFVNRYKDENNNLYGIDKSGRLIEYSNQLLEETSIGTNINQEKAVKIAFEQLNQNFADIAKGFELSYIDFNNETYTVELQKKYGEGGFAFGEKMLLYIRSDGEVEKWYMNGIEELTGFDKSLLNGITENKVIDFAKTQLNAAIENSADEYSLSSISIKKINGQFALRIYMKNPEGTYGKEIYYAL